MARDFRAFIQDLYLKVGALPVVVRARLRAPKWIKRGDRLKAKQDIPVQVFYDWRHRCGSFPLTVPAGTDVIYEGPSMYSDFSLVFPEEVLRAHGRAFFVGNEWLLDVPDAYTVEVTSKFPELILQKS